MVIVNCGGVYGELLLVAIEHMLYLFIFGFIHSCLDDLKFLYWGFIVIVSCLVQSSYSLIPTFLHRFCAIKNSQCDFSH